MTAIITAVNIPRAHFHIVCMVPKESANFWTDLSLSIDQSLQILEILTVILRDQLQILNAFISERGRFIS